MLLPRSGDRRPLSPSFTIGTARRGYGWMTTLQCRRHCAGNPPILGVSGPADLGDDVVSPTISLRAATAATGVAIALLGVSACTGSSSPTGAGGSTDATGTATAQVQTTPGASPSASPSAQTSGAGATSAPQSMLDTVKHKGCSTTVIVKNAGLAG